MADVKSTMDILWDYKEDKVSRLTTLLRLKGQTWNPLGAETLVDMVDKGELCLYEEEDSDG